MKVPCIVVKTNNKGNDDRPHGMIMGLYPNEHDDVFGEGSIDKMLALFQAGTGYFYEYIKAEVEMCTIIELDGWLYHPAFYRARA